MMIAITGTVFNTANGMIVVHNEQNVAIIKGQTISVNGTPRTILAVIPPTAPDGKWSLKLN